MCQYLTDRFRSTPPCTEVSNFIQSGASLKSWWTASAFPPRHKDRRDGCRHVSQADSRTARHGQAARPAFRTTNQIQRSAAACP
jgi:hypothetical protein